MRDVRAFCGEADLREGEEMPLPRDEVHHLRRVLRVSEGDEVLLLNGRGREARAVLRSDGLATVREITREESPPPPREICCAVTRTKAFEDTLERCIELGITAFHPVVTDHAVTKTVLSKAGKKTARWEELAAQRLKQCERLWMPRVHPVITLQEHLEQPMPGDMTRLLLAERRGALPLADAAAGTRALRLYVGPEGGWSQTEFRRFEELSVPFVTLGPAILRTETALVAAAGTLLALRPGTG